MKALKCPFCDSNKLSVLSEKTIKCDYCETVFLIEDKLMPETIEKAEFDQKTFFDKAMIFLAEYPTAPADIFDSKFEDIKIQLRPFKSAHYDVNLIYDRETLDPDSKNYVPFYSLRYIYRGKSYYLGAYGIGETRSYGVPPDALKSISEDALKRSGKDTLGVISLILGLICLFIDSSIVRILALALLTLGIVITCLFYKKYKKEKAKGIIKNSEERRANYESLIRELNHN